ncbi:unnamed protein product [Clavelina lepadiformis]|uniref:Spermatogenesis-associated protein 13 n=1 Tax=Clavelina lepadiformis TaxID=159417 RepID=A0ABP0FDU4_CLALP
MMMRVENGNLGDIKLKRNQPNSVRTGPLKAIIHYHDRTTNSGHSHDLNCQLEQQCRSSKCGNCSRKQKDAKPKRRMEQLNLAPGTLGNCNQAVASDSTNDDNNRCKIGTHNNVKMTTEELASASDTKRDDNSVMKSVSLNIDRSQTPNTELDCHRSEKPRAKSKQVIHSGSSLTSILSTPAHACCQAPEAGCTTPRERASHIRPGPVSLSSESNSAKRHAFESSSARHFENFDKRRRSDIGLDIDQQTFIQSGLEPVIVERISIEDDSKPATSTSKPFVSLHSDRPAIATSTAGNLLFASDPLERTRKNDTEIGTEIVSQESLSNLKCVTAGAADWHAAQSCPISEQLHCHKQRCSEVPSNDALGGQGSHFASDSERKVSISQIFNNNRLKPEVWQRTTPTNWEQPHHKSSLEVLGCSTSRRQALIRGDQHPSLGSRKNAPLVIQEDQNHQEVNHLEQPDSEHPFPNRKRLCESLIDITAEDLLSVPCASIFEGRSTTAPSTPNNRGRISTLITENRLHASHRGGSCNNIMPGRSKESSRGRAAVSDKPLHNRLSEADLNKLNSKKSSTKSVEIVTTTSTSQREQLENNENKPVQKIPKLTKSLFPFMRKNKKRNNSGSNGTGKPLKADNRDALKSNCAHPKANAGHKMDVDMEDNNEVTTRSSDDCPSTEVVGFRKLKVASKQTQRNIHADYATRVARVRHSSGPTNPSDESSPVSSTSLGRHKEELSTNGVVYRDKPRPRRDVSRRSADVTSSSEHLVYNNRQRRPSSLAVASGDHLWRHSDVIKRNGGAEFPRRASNVSTDLRTVVHTNPEEGKRKQEVTGRLDADDNLTETKLRNNSVAICQHNGTSSWLTKEQQAELARCSLDLNFLRNASFNDQMPFISSLPGPETRLTGSKSGSSLNGISTPGSSILTAEYLSVARGSIASSYCSVFDNDDSLKVKVESLLEPNDIADKNSVNETRPKVVMRSKSVYREKAPSQLKIDAMNRRSISPTFQETVYKCGFHYDNRHSLQGRIQSLKDLSSYRRPNKPTTPKPRKMSSSSSTSSLNKFNFKLSSQNLNTNCAEAGSTASNFKNQEAIQDFAGDVRSVPASAKNASIRRRMSFQAYKPVDLDVIDDEMHRRQQNDKLPVEWKRHSIAGLDSEMVKNAMARWNIGATNVAGSSGKRSRRRNRPLSEVQNLRWDVQAIPEHKEISDEVDPTSPKPTQAPANVTCATSSERYTDHDLTQAGALHITPSHCLLHCDVDHSFRSGVLGTCFSEEDVSMTTEEEMLGNSPAMRSLSVIGGLNTLPDSLIKFYPAKYFPDGLQRSPMASSPTSHSTFGHGMADRSRVQGSTVSGISNESGYGTMTRKNATLRPAEIEDEDVFLQSNATRLSNGDFPNDDGVYVEALWDHVTMDTEELGFKVGDVIRVIDLSNADWWWGELDSKEGWFPATFVRILVNQHRDDSDSGEVISARNDDDNQSISSHEFNRVTCFGDECCQCPDPVETSEMSCEKCGKPVTSNSADRCANAPDSQEHPEIVISSPTSFNSRKSLHARDRIRKNVINEIVNSEKVFVGHLKDVIEGYLTRCRKRPDMFTDQQISTLFGNIEDIFHFQIKFSAELEAAVDRSAVHSTHLGEVFLNHKSGFAIYSEYCNNHPQALSLLSEMLSGKKYMHFLEACRLLQKMIDISLDGFLLTPVQKICKYPLQLAELLKYTNPEHPDYEPVKSALDTMKGVARMINERKRRMENIKKISLWQSTIVNWQGDDVLVRSSELVHSGDVYSVSKSKKSKIRMAFLFDHQMILCKKDLLRRDLFYYKTRIDLDRCDVNPLDGESPRVSSSSGEWTSTSSQSGQHGWKITDRESGEKTVMLCKSEEDMARWMKAFALEREMSLTRNDDLSLVHDSLLKGALANLLVSPRKPKETSMSRAPSYRYRMKMAQELNQSKHKGVSSGEKSGSFFSNVAGKLTPFRRQAVRESGLAF